MGINPPSAGARAAGFIPQDRPRKARPGRFERQAAQERSCGLKSALLPALRAGARDLSRRTVRGRRAQGGSTAKLLRNGPADSSPRSFPRCALERGIYPAGPPEEGARREVRTPSCSGTVLRTQVRAPLWNGGHQQSLENVGAPLPPAGGSLLLTLFSPFVLWRNDCAGNAA